MPTTRIIVEADIRVRGPLYDGRDKQILRRFFVEAKTLVAKSGQEELKARALRQPKHPRGRFSDAIVVKDFKKGKTIIADYPQVLYGPWLEGVSARNRSTRFKGYRMFRLTLGRLRKNVGPLVHDLWRKAVDELNGGR